MQKHDIFTRLKISVAMVTYKNRTSPSSMLNKYESEMTGILLVFI